MSLSGFVLAGGQSRRMGRDKAELNWRGRTLLDHMIQIVRSVADPVHVVGRDPLPDRLPGLGPLSGIATGLETSSTVANLFVAVDLPFLTKDFLIYLRSRIKNSTHGLVACKIGSLFPLCLGVRRFLLPEINRRLNAGTVSVMALIEAIETEIILETQLTALGFDRSLFRNINTDKDYESALREP